MKATVAPSTARDIPGYSVFPPIVMYASDYLKAQGDLQRVQDYISSGIGCLDTAASYLTGTYTPDQQITVDANSQPAQQLGFARSWLSGALSVLNGIPCPCSGAYPYNPRWLNDVANVAAGLNSALSALGDFNLDSSGHVTGSAWHNPLLSTRAAASAMKAIVDTSACANDHTSSGGSGGDGGGGEGGGPPING